MYLLFFSYFNWNGNLKYDPRNFQLSLANYAKKQTNLFYLACKECSHLSFC